jgi:hypothetical protein
MYSRSLENFLTIFKKKLEHEYRTNKTTHNYESIIYTIKQKCYEVSWREWVLASATPSGSSLAAVAARAAGAAEVAGVAGIGRPGTDYWTMDDWILFYVFYMFLLFTFIRWWRIRLGIKRNWNETENWLEKKSTPFFPPASVTSPPERKCLDIIPVLPSHSFPPDLSFWEKVHAYSCKSSTREAVFTSVRFLCCHARIASGEIILLTDNELLAFTWGSRKVKTERPYQFWSQIFTSFPSTVEHLPRRSTTRPS